MEKMTRNKDMATKNPREAAFLALLSFLQEETFVGEWLRSWKALASPLEKDFAFAQEIAYGSARMALALDHLAEQLTDKEKLKLKNREKALLRIAFYQYYFMDRVPIYALVNETVHLAKKYCHASFVRFLNALLRRVESAEITLPKGETVPEISVRYSYPVYFVQELVTQYGLEKTIDILEAGNTSHKPHVRLRGEGEVPEGIEKLTGTHFPMGVISDSKVIPKIANSRDFYIQNATPCELVAFLAEGMTPPNRVLDLCASPGGKLLAVHDVFSETKEFVANDVSTEKIRVLTENLEKFKLDARVSCSFGEKFEDEGVFDLIILDVPCSNTGVLSKRVEARWRLSSKQIEELEAIQYRLLRRTAELLSENGEIWYLTCSILQRENEAIVKWAEEELGLKIRAEKRFLPNQSGWDGGFGAALTRRTV